MSTFAFVAPPLLETPSSSNPGVLHLGASESTWRQTIHRGDEVILEAEIHAAATNLAGRPVRAPEALRNALRTIELS